MRCSKAEKFLSPYIDGELGARETALLESHLAQCEKCAGKFEEIKKLRGLFMGAERFPSPNNFAAEVMERVSGQPSRGFALIPVFTRFAEAFAFVLAIALGIISASLFINTVAPRHNAKQIVTSLSLDTFEALPPGSMGRAYLTLTEERR
jgi:anti-sigma factor RsiW